jgi:DsbC/DsbD-like thiol-disulfide interchange protein
MNKFLLLALMTVFSAVSFAQSDREVEWTFTAKKIADKTYEVHMTANINGDYHIYAQDGGDGPVSTSFTFKKSPLLLLEGEVKEVGKVKKVYEDAFKSQVKYYEGTVTFVQVVKLKGNAKTNLAGSVEFMVCNAHECLPPATVNFSIPIGG